MTAVSTRLVRVPHRRPLLSVLPVLVVPDAIGATVLAGSRGEALTLVRATSKTCVKADWSLVTLANDAPCVELPGLLVEPLHINTVENSEAINLWNLRGTCTATPGQTAPDGTANACRVAGVVDAVSGDLYCNTNGGDVSDDVALSFWIRRVSASGVLDITPAGGGSGHWTVDMSLLPTGWIRLTAVSAAVTVLESFGGMTSQGIQIHRASGATPLSFDFWGVQTEAGAVIHSYVKTGSGSSATSNADVASLSPGPLPVAQGSIKFDFVPRWNDGSPLRVLLWTRSAGHGVGIKVTGTQVVVDVEGAGSVLNSANLSWVAGTLYHFKLQWAAGNIYLWRNGVLIASVTNGSAPVPSAHDTLYLGSADGSFQCDGWIKNFQAYRT